MSAQGKRKCEEIQETDIGDQEERKRFKGSAKEMSKLIHTFKQQP